MTSDRLVPLLLSLVGTAVIVGLIVVMELGVDRPARDVRGIPPCPVGAEKNLLDPAALECWFKASHGLWRTRYRVWVHSVLLVNVDAANLRDAQEIAQRFVDERAGEFREIAVYVREDGAPEDAKTRRVTWTRESGDIDVLDF